MEYRRIYREAHETEHLCYLLGEGTETVHREDQQTRDRQKIRQCM